MSFFNSDDQHGDSEDYPHGTPENNLFRGILVAVGAITLVFVLIGSYV